MLVTAIVPLVLCFNSMKVRLKPFAPYPKYYKALFQFHEGPIKTQQASDVNDFANVSIP